MAEACRRQIQKTDRWVVFHIGMVAVMKYVPGTIVAVTLLLGPIIATLEGLALGTDEVPGPWTMAGAVINIAASALIAADAQNQSKTVQLKELEVN